MFLMLEDSFIVRACSAEIINSCEMSSVGEMKVSKLQCAVSKLQHSLCYFGVRRVLSELAVLK